MLLGDINILESRFLAITVRVQFICRPSNSSAVQMKRYGQEYRNFRITEVLTGLTNRMLSNLTCIIRLICYKVLICEMLVPFLEQIQQSSFSISVSNGKWDRFIVTITYLRSAEKNYC